MTPRGRVALVLGLVLVAVAMLAGTVEVRAGQHACGSAASAHAPIAGTASAQGRAEDACDNKITNRRVLVGVIGLIGLGLALGGAYDHPRGDRRIL
jgi:hypothetical protein